MNSISKYTINFISVSFVLLNLLFASYSLAKDHNFFSSSENSLYRLAISKHELHYYDEPSVSSDGQWIAYTVKERVDNPTEFQYFLPDGTPTPMAGCCIYLSSHDGKQVQQIAPNTGYSWRPVWSPNGEKLAFYSNASGKCSLWIYDLSSGLSRELSDLPINSTIYADDKPIWNPEGTEIYVPLALSNQLQSKISFFKKNPPLPNQNETIVKRFSTDETPSDHLDAEQKSLNWLISSLASIDVKTGSARIVISDQTNPAPSYMKLSSTGKWLSYRTIPKFLDNPSKSSYDLVISGLNGECQFITVAENITTDGDGKDYIWHPRKDILVYEKDKKLHLVELDDKGVKRSAILLSDSPIEFIKKPLLFTQDGNFLIVGGKPYRESYQDKPASLFIISLNESQTPIEIQIKSPWKYLSTVNANDSEAFQQNKDEILVSLEKEDTGETAIVKLDITHSIAIDEGHFAWKGVAKLQAYPAKKNLDINYWVYEDLSTPANIYCTGTDLSYFHRVSDIESKLNQLETPISKVFETYISSYNGGFKKVKTTILLPKNYNPENPPPGIVLFYPGSNISNYIREFSGGDPVLIPNFLFLNYGYALILPDVPLKPDGEASHRIQEIINALLPQVYHAIDLNYIDPNRIGIMGHSYGGYSTAAVITQTQLFKAAVASAGVYDLGGLYGYFDDSLSFFCMKWLEHGQGGMGMPLWDNPQHYFENSPYYLADKIHTPLLLIHGEDDLTCPVIEARKMFTALKRLNGNVELALYPGQGHVMRDWNQASELDGTIRTISFFNKHLLTNDFTKGNKTNKK